MSAPPVAGTPTRRDLAALALLSAWMDVGRGPLLNFMPFAVEVLKKWSDEMSRFEPRDRVESPVRAHALASALRSEWGLPLLAIEVAELVLERALDEELLFESDGQLFLNHERLNGVPSLCEDKQKLLQDMNALVRDLQRHVKATYDKDWTREYAREALERFTEEFGPELAQARRRHLSLAPLMTSDEVLKVVHGFAREAVENDPATFHRLEALVRGWILVNALYLPAVGSLWRPLTDLRILFDAPLALQALGLSNDPDCAATRELLDLLEALGAKVFVVDHTLVETRGLLDRMTGKLRMRGVRRGGQPATCRDKEALEAARRKHWDASDLERRSNHLEEFLAGAGIQVMESPPHAVQGHLDEQKLFEIVNAEMGPGTTARRFDADSVAAVIRSRSDSEAHDLSAAEAVFVTASVGLARAYRRFCEEEQITTKIPHVMLRKRLTALAWVRLPQRKTGLAGKLLLAECYAGLNPDAEIWERWQHHFAKLEYGGGPSAEEFRDRVTKFHGSPLFEGPPAPTREDSRTELDLERAWLEEERARLAGQVRELIEEVASERKRADEAAQTVDRQHAYVASLLSAQEAEGSLAVPKDKVSGLVRENQELKQREANRLRNRKRIGHSVAVTACVAASISSALVVLGEAHGKSGWPTLVTGLVGLAMGAWAWGSRRAIDYKGVLAAIAVLVTIFMGAWTVVEPRNKPSSQGPPHGAQRPQAPSVGPAKTSGQGKQQPKKRPGPRTP